MKARTVVVALVGLYCPMALADVIWSKCTEPSIAGPIESFVFAIGQDKETAEHNSRILSAPTCKIELQCKIGWYAQVGSPMVRGEPQNSAEGVSCGALTEEEALQQAYEACLAVKPNSYKRTCRTFYHLGFDDDKVGTKLNPDATSMTGGENDLQGCLDKQGKVGLAVPRGKLPVCY
ncbi:MAG TPA: hypothetical protein VFB54_14215 [Burkholderiales bacterium]|nr:hypothetical protein [Burkholderiales bacterium]